MMVEHQQPLNIPAHGAGVNLVKARTRVPRLPPGLGGHYVAPMSQPLALSSRVVASTHQVSTTLSGEAVILHMTDGIYFGLNAVGATIWGRMQQPVALAAVVDHVTATFDVDRDTAERDVLRISAELADKGLLDLVGEPTS